MTERRLDSDWPTNPANMFARAAAIGGHTTGPAFAVAGGGSIHELQGFVIDVGIGVGRKGPDLADVLFHFCGVMKHSAALAAASLAAWSLSYRSQASQSWIS